MTEKILFKIERGSLIPADNYQAEKLRLRKFKIGQIVNCVIMKMRNPKFNKLSHALGKLVVQNVEGFENYDAHLAIKRLQIEGRIACDEIGINIPGYGMAVQYIPRSLSFESMDEEEFQDTMKAISRFLAVKYWPQCTPEEIERMAELAIVEG